MLAMPPRPSAPVRRMSLELVRRRFEQKSRNFPSDVKEGKRSWKFSSVMCWRPPPLARAHDVGRLDGDVAVLLKAAVAQVAQVFHGHGGEGRCDHRRG